RNNHSAGKNAAYRTPAAVRLRRPAPAPGTVRQSGSSFTPLSVAWAAGWARRQRRHRIVPGEGFFVREQDVPFTLQGCDSLLACRPCLQEVERGIETARNKCLEFSDPEASLLLDREFKASRVSQ